MRWVLAPAADQRIGSYVWPQREVGADGHDDAIETLQTRLAIELDGFEFRGNRTAFSYGRGSNAPKGVYPTHRPCGGRHLPPVCSAGNLGAVVAVIRVEV